MEQKEIERVAAAQAALEQLNQGMEADGYHLDVQDVRGEVATVRVDALADACEECLVPKEVLEGIIQVTIPPSLGISSIHLLYPTD